MVISEQPCYLLMQAPPNFHLPQEARLKRDLEFGTDKVKLEALKAIILMQLNGERLTSLLTHILRFLLPSNDRAIKKTLYLFWEIFPKRNAEGKLLEEMILVCESYRKDLQHPNEFIRGSTLRFVGKLKEPELLTLLIPAVKSSLNHRAAYVRRNAVIAIFAIYRNFPVLVSDGSELIKGFLETDLDMSCQRNAFLTLLHSNETEALKFLSSRLDHIPHFCDTLQLIIVKLIYKICLESPNERSRFIRTVYSLLNSTNSSIRYEAASTLLTLSYSPTAIRAAASAFINLVIHESDNNAKMIIFNKLVTLKDTSILRDLATDILRVLTCGCLDLKTKTLDLVVHLSTRRHIDAIIMILKRETNRIQKISDDDSITYQLLLVQAFHKLCNKFPSAIESVLPLAFDFFSSCSEVISREITLFLREVALKSTQARRAVIDGLVEAFPSVSSSEVLRSAVWILGEFTTSKDELKKGLETILMNMYDNGQVRIPILRRFVFGGDYFLATTVAVSLTKMTLKLMPLRSEDEEVFRIQNRSVLCVSKILNLGKTTGNEMSDDSVKRIYSCLQVLSVDSTKFEKSLFVDKNWPVLAKMLSLKSKDGSVKSKNRVVSIDSPVFFFQLSYCNFAKHGTKNLFDLSLDQVLCNRDSSVDSTRVAQLTGMSDPVFVEARINLSRFNICLDVFILNQTCDTLTNCTLELAAIGELKLFDKPQSTNLGPYESTRIETCVKITSIENSIIFGSLTYETRNGRSHSVVLDDIYVNVMDYIRPADCSDSEFQRKWMTFEWENKVNVDVDKGELIDYLRSILRSTDMRCLTPEKIFEADCDFLGANLYAQSIFGEDALVNLSIEKLKNGRIIGHVRIRAKSQGLALSLGEQFITTQKK